MLTAKTQRIIGGMVGALVAILTTLASPGVRVIMVVPPGERPWPDAQARLDVAMKDVQWWYAAQMEAYGYGEKTFALELDDKGKVVVHSAELKESIPDGPKSGVPGSIIPTAETVLGNPGKRNGTVMLVYYTGYYWDDRKRATVSPLGRGSNGRWAHLNAWHYYSINPAGWHSMVPVPQLPMNNAFFSPAHTRVLQAFTGDGSRTVAARTSVAYGSIMHELGHAFGLHHPTGGHPRGDVMAGDYWKVRGNFLEAVQGEWCCLSPGDAAILNKNPLFQERSGIAASTGAPLGVGMRGAGQLD